MNRIRKVGSVYQVLITPYMTMSPDSSILLGNWDDINLRGYRIVEFKTLQGAQMEAFKHPDIDWYKIISGHKYIKERLDETIKRALGPYYFGFIETKLMDPDEFKNSMFDRVMIEGKKFSTRANFGDVIKVTVVAPSRAHVHEIKNLLTKHREHLWRDDLRIIKVMKGDCGVMLIGKTEFGTTYTIRLTTPVFHHHKKCPENFNF